MEKFGQMRLKIYSKNNFVTEMQDRLINDNTVEGIDEYFICIDSSGGDVAVPYFKQLHPNVIRETFDDVPKDIKKWGPDIQAYFNAIAITEEQAKNLVEFIRDIPFNSLVHIHCFKGESRSKAVADFIDETILSNEIYDDGADDSGYYRIKELMEKQWIS